MNLAKLSLGTSVPTETFLNIINELAVFDSIHEPFVGDTIQKNELAAEILVDTLDCESLLYLR